MARGEARKETRGNSKKSRGREKAEPIRGTRKVARTVSKEERVGEIGEIGEIGRLHALSFFPERHR